MAPKTLKTFGEKLKQYRKQIGLNQEALAESLGLLHAAHGSELDLRTDGNLISKWERAYTDKKGRQWHPSYQSILYLIEIFADQLTLEEAQAWAGEAGYHLSRLALQKFFPATSALETPLQQTYLTPLALLPDQQFFGFDQYQQRLRQLLEQRDAPWLVAIDGIGGIGKTSLAVATVKTLAATDCFYDIVWVSAKQEEFGSMGKLQTIDRPALGVETFINILLEYLGQSFALTRPVAEKRLILANQLQTPYLIVIDNLETVADYQTLLPLLRQLVKPSKLLLTSRRSLYEHADVFCMSIQELNRSDTYDLLRFEARLKDLPELAEAPKNHLDQIYQVVGGHPLALKLVVGQTRILPLGQVLKNLELAQSNKVDDLYTYIYWQVWQNLDEAGREVLLAMPLAQGGTLDQLLAITEVEEATLQSALEQLTLLSLLEIGGDLMERRYHIHRLTETFLLNEVIKWQKSF